jgi:hypothetical protein
MNTRMTFVSFLLFLSLSFSQAQEQKIRPSAALQMTAQNAASKSLPVTTPLFKEIDHSIPGDKWAISVRPRSSRKHYAPGVAEIKEAKLQQKLNTYHPSGDPDGDTRAVTPKIATNFEANWSIESTPPDNTIAIANNGNIITANNDGIEYYNGSGTFLYFDYWVDFIDDNTLTSTFFDPKVIYDSGADRFVLTLLHGSNANTSQVLVCFSKTNNPLNGWWVYTLTGNPLENDCWFDYPGLGVSNNEIYITGNLFRSSFNQAVIYQIPKAEGYAGNELLWQYWSGLTSDPYDAFTIIPASFGHQGNYGPGIYLVSNESAGENRIRFWDLTDDMLGSPQLVSYTVPVDPYSPAADALQDGTHDQLDNGDCRIQNAFYLNGIVHYVFHSDIGDGWNGIHYNRLDVADIFNVTSTFGLQGSYDYSYPAVVPFSTSNTDLSVMIAFLRSSENSFPDVRVVNCDHQMNWSSSTLVKAGETYVDFLNDDERWGDYTGVARRHNSNSPRIWLAGCYGANINSQSVFNTFKTWVAEVEKGAVVSTAETISEKSVSVFPNPAYDLINIEFTAEARQMTTIEVIDFNGHVLRQLYRDTPREGENRLTFNKGALPAGTYIISIKTNTKILKNETIVVVD